MKIIVKGPKLKEETIYSKENIRVDKILEKYKDKMPNPIYACKVNNCYRGLNHEIHHDSIIEFLDISNNATWNIYINSLIFVYIKAVHDVMGKNYKVSTENSLNKGLFTNIYPSVNEEDVLKIKARMNEIVKLDLPIKKEYMSLENAKNLAKQKGLKETVDLLDTIKSKDDLYIYSLDNETEIFYSLMVPSTIYLKYFDLTPYRNGVLLRYPHENAPETIPEYIDQKLLYNAFADANKCGKIMGIDYVSDLNKIVTNKNYEELFLIQEALHEKRISDIADKIKKENKKIILICGPSSSGKTTFAKRLSVQLKVLGLKPLYISTDDYFKEKDEKPLDENGEVDLESIKAVDVDLFQDNLNNLLNGQEVDMPTFDFVNTTKIFGQRIVKLDLNSVIVIEGIHALNKLLTESIDDKEKFKIYISPFTPIGIDHQNRISTTDARMLRRLVRDYQFRGRSAKTTLADWPKVRKGENVNIFPFNKEADVFFNSNCIYELAVLKKYAEPLLKDITRSEPEFAEAQKMLGFLKFIVSIDDDSKIVNNSIIREFIGGSSLVQ